jgi:hypothetical protein
MASLGQALHTSRSLLWRFELFRKTAPNIALKRLPFLEHSRPHGIQVNIIAHHPQAKIVAVPPKRDKVSLMSLPRHCECRRPRWLRGAASAPRRSLAFPAGYCFFQDGTAVSFAFLRGGASLWLQDVALLEHPHANIERAFIDLLFCGRKSNIRIEVGLHGLVHHNRWALG